MKHFPRYLALASLLLAGVLGQAQTAHSVKLSWTAPTKDVNGVALPITGTGSLTAFNVKRATALAGPFTTIGSPFPTAGYTDSSLPASCSTGCTLYYEVTAVNSGGESSPLGPTSAVIPAVTIAVPSVPSVLIIQVQ